MITVAEIQSWVRGGESETVEFKRTTGERREAARTICAMLNHRGGRVIFGVEPDGRMIGQMVSDRTVEEVAQALANAFCHRDYGIGHGATFARIRRAKPHPPQFRTLATLRDPAIAGLRSCRAGN